MRSRMKSTFHLRIKDPPAAIQARQQHQGYWVLPTPILTRLEDLGASMPLRQL